MKMPESDTWKITKSVFKIFQKYLLSPIILLLIMTNIID